nr:hypothetical protein [Alloyangia mangrovi]
MPVVRQAQLGRAAAPPVRDQRREGAPAGFDGLNRAEAGVAGADQLAAVAGLEGAIGVETVDVISDKDRGPILPGLPGGGESGGPGVALRKLPRLGGILEAALAEPAQHDIRSDPQHEEIELPVAVDVQRVGAGDAGQLWQFAGLEA